MGWSLRRFPLTKAVPLAISRGTTSVVDHLEVSLSAEGVTGRGEAGGLDTGGPSRTPGLGPGGVFRAQHRLAQVRHKANVAPRQKTRRSTASSSGGAVGLVLEGLARGSLTYDEMARRERLIAVVKRAVRALNRKGEAQDLWVD